MQVIFPIVIMFVLALYGGLHYYIGLRGWQAFSPLLPVTAARVYFSLYIVLALAYPLGRLAQARVPGLFSDALTNVGAYWMGAAYYLLLCAVLVDLVRLADARWRVVPGVLYRQPALVGAGVVLLVAGLLVYGAWNARHPRLRHYDITIPKPAGTLASLHVVMLSDLHLGVIVNVGRLARVVQRVNALHPDLVVLPGDTIDEDVGPFTRQKMGDVLRQLHPRDGVYAILGNHEYIGGQVEAAVRALQASGVTVLRDDRRTLPGGIVLAGRDEQAGQRFHARPRKDLDTILHGVDRRQPIILLDHRPIGLNESVQAGVDLQLSGHTHHGQFFPNNLITSRIYEQDWGYLRKGALQLIVSCGVGTWGPPIRIGNTPEIVDIAIHFAPPSR